MCCMLPLGEFGWQLYCYDGQDQVLARCVQLQPKPVGGLSTAGCACTIELLHGDEACMLS